MHTLLKILLCLLGRDRIFGGGHLARVGTKPVCPKCVFSTQGYARACPSSDLNGEVVSPLSTENEAPKCGVWTWDCDGKRPARNGIFKAIGGCLV